MVPPSGQRNRGRRGRRGRGGANPASASHTAANGAGAMSSNASHPRFMVTETTSNAARSGRGGGRGARGGRGRGGRGRGGRGRGGRGEAQVEVNSAHATQGARGGRGGRGQRGRGRGRGGRAPGEAPSSMLEDDELHCSCGHCNESDEDDNDDGIEIPICEEHLNAFMQMRMMMMGMDPEEAGCDCGECITPQHLFMSAMMADMMGNDGEDSESDGLIADVEESSDEEDDDQGLQCPRPLRIGLPINDDWDDLPELVDASNSDSLPDLINETSSLPNAVGATRNLPNVDEDCASMPDLVEDSDTVPDLHGDSNDANNPTLVSDADTDTIPDLISPSDESVDGPQVLEWAAHGGDMVQFLRESQALLLFLREVASRAPKLGEAFAFSPLASSFRDVARAVAKSAGANVHIMREGLLEHGNKVPLFVTVDAAMSGKTVSVEAFERALCRGLEKHFPLNALVDKVGSRTNGGNIGWVCHGDSLLDVEFTGPSA